MHKSLMCMAMLFLSACAGGSGSAPAPLPGSPAATPPPQSSTPIPPRGSFRAPQLQQDRALNGVIGERASALTARFGKARIDLSEGDARKLQFTGSRCVLDIFLYPLGSGQEPVATHVEARLREGGGEIDRARCIAEIERNR